MYYAKWMERLAKMDTKVTKAQRRKEFWYVLEIAGVFMNWEREYYVINAIYIAFQFLLITYYVPCFIVSMFKVDDLAAIGQFLNYTSLTLIAIAFIISTHLNRENILGMLSLNAQGFYDYGNTLETEEIEKMVKLFDKMKKLLLVVVPPWMMLVATSVMVGDYVDAIFGYHTNKEQDYINGVYQHMPLKMWFTHTIDTQFKWFVFLASEVMSSGEVAIAIGAATLIMIFFAQTLIIQMKTLIIALRAMDLRVDQHYATAFGQKPPVDPIRRRKNKRLMECYKACLRQTIEHHKTIIQYFEMYNAFMNLPTGMGVLTGAVLLGMSSITLLQGGGQPSLMVITTLLIIPELCALFIVCEIGETVKGLSEDMFYATYQFEWSDCSKEIMKEVRIMRSRMTEPMILYGILSPLNRDTFGTIMNSAYSYINLLRASDEAGQ